ncbi:hypothetical protein FBR02_07950, partial [Anaerolineae bacterium CFX9]|nr:hypothetical protein [Anaerolineae bacterium CFX9]
MGFDVENFGLGLLAGWGTAYGVYRMRNQIRGAITSVRRGAATAQTSAAQSADSRYVNDMTERAQTTHLGGMNVPLTQVIVEPRFIPAPDLAAPPDEDAIFDIFRVIPEVPDHPYLQAPYNIETLSLDELSLGSRKLALLGLPGSGRTTALHTLMLHSLGEVRFTPPVDKIQNRLDTEEAGLSEKDRAVRVKERVLMEQRAREQLANEKGIAFDAQADEVTRAAIPLFKRLMPVYVHMADVIAPTSEYGGEIDPAEPLVRAVQYSVRRVTASTIPRNLYKRLNKGDVLVLIDGFDDLPLSERPQALSWLGALMQQYGGNFFIVTGPATGYGQLTRLGLTPVFIRPWNDLDTDRTAEGWAAAWGNMSKKRRGGKRPDTEAITRAKKNNRALLPLEVTQKVWSNFTETVEMAGPEGWMRASIARLLPADQTLAASLPRLAALAALQLDEGYITSARLQALSIGGEAASSALADVEEEEPDIAEALRTEQTDKGRKRKAKKASAAENEGADSEMSTAQGRLLASLRKSGLLVRYKGDRYQFRHPLIAAYLASLTLKNARPEELRAKANLASWSQAIAYSAMHTPVDSLVETRLNTRGDVLCEHLFSMARWLAYAPPDADWRGDVLRELGNLVIAPNQYPLVRERAAAALLDTRDRNALLVYRRAIRNANPVIRRLGCLGMGALGDEESIRELRSLLQDQNAEVQLSAGMALGAIGTDEALEAMIIAFTDGSEQLQQAMAEAFAAMPDEGYPILFEAVSHEDMSLRRAAIFGLRRIRTTWALIAIYRAFLEDEQWYVRSAAQEAFEMIQYGRSEALTNPYPSVDSLPWLREWAASR